MSSERYIRQTVLKGFGEQGQEKLSKAKVLIVGAGGLGVPATTYLNAMGIGCIGIVDADTVSLTNLHRQVLYTESDVGKPKIEVAIERLSAQNAQTDFIAHNVFLNRNNALELIKNYDVVVDGTDNFPTRYLINDACVILNKPFVYGALYGYEGQVSVFNHQGGPTYRCLFPSMPKPDEVPNCDEHGVLGVLPGIIGNFQALETVKILSGIGQVLSGKLLLYNALSQTIQNVKFSIKPEYQNLGSLAADYNFACPTSTFSVEVEEFHSLRDKKKIFVLDVRSRAEYEHSHLPEAIHISLHDLEERVDQIPNDQNVYVVCQSGIRSLKAISILQKERPEQQFINIAGGMNKVYSYAH